MISSKSEYRQALEEASELSNWLDRLESAAVAERKTLTISSVRMMIARVQQEIATYEANNVSSLSGKPRGPSATDADSTGPPEPE